MHKQVKVMGTPQQIGVIIQNLNSRLAERPFSVGSTMAGTAGRNGLVAGIGGLFGMRIPLDANPVHVSIGDSHRTWATVKVYAIPAGAMMSLDVTDSDWSCVAPHWQSLIDELTELDMVTYQVRLEGKDPCRAVFYLDGTTARDAATWLAVADSWSDLVRVEKPDKWKFDLGYHVYRRYQCRPVKEAIDSQGRIWLTVGLTEVEDSVPSMGAGRTHEVGTVVNSNDRAIEIQVLPAGNNRVKVSAACNAFLLLKKLADLLEEAKWNNKDHLQLAFVEFGDMDRPPLGVNPNVDLFVSAQIEYFKSIISSIEPKWTLLKPEDESTPRDDGPAVVDEVATTPEPETAAHGLSPDKVELLKHLWTNDNYSHSDIAKRLGEGYTADYVRKEGYRLKLPKRKSGRKPSR